MDENNCEWQEHISNFIKLNWNNRKDLIIEFFKIKIKKM